MNSGWKRWWEAILVASAISAGLTVLWILAIGFLVPDGGNRIAVHVGWLAVGLAILGALVAWLMWLSLRVRGLRARPEGVAPPGAMPRPVEVHPHQQLLDQIDALADHLKGYDQFDLVSWDTGQIYNELISDARAVDSTLNLRALPTATREEMGSGPSTVPQNGRDLVAGLRQARVHVERVGR